MLIDTEKLIKVAMYGKVSQKGRWHNGMTQKNNLLICLTKGTLKMQIGCAVLSAGAGDALLIPAKTKYVPLDSSGLEYYFFHFIIPEATPGTGQLKIGTNPALPDGEYAYSYISDINPVINVEMLTHYSGNVRVKDIIEKTAALNIWHNGAEKLLLDCYIRELLVLFSTELSTRRNIDRNLSRILHYIDSSFSEDITLSSLAVRFGLSQSYIARLFKDDLHTRSSDYINKVRMATACDLLSNTDMSIGEISGRTGYINQYYFSRVFRKIYGITPSDFRRSLHMKS